MASISAKGSRGYHTFTLTVTESEINAANNTSTLSYALSISAVDSSYYWSQQGTSISYSVTINGTVVESNYYPDYDGTTKNIVTGTTIVNHDAGGAKSVTISFAINDRDEDVGPGDASASGTMALTDFSVITYDANGGSGTMEVTRYAYATSGTTKLRTNTFKRTGYTFLGWSLSKTATIESYSDGRVWSLSNKGDYTLYAVWQLNTYELSISAGEGAKVTVKNGSAILANDASISYGDSLTITFEAASGYEIETHTVNGNTFTSGGSHTVTGAVAVVATAKMLGLVYICDGASFAKYLVYIYDGTSWNMYIPYIYDGSAWRLCS